MDFTLDLANLGTSVSTSLASMSPLFFVVAGLIVAGGILAWGVSMLKKWRTN